MLAFIDILKSTSTGSLLRWRFHDAFMAIGGEDENKT
jgi:hypothetical protein